MVEILVVGSVSILLVNFKMLISKASCIFICFYYNKMDGY